MSLLLALVLAVEAAPSQVTLPLEEYTRLKGLDERPSLTVVELVRIEGSFARGDLSLVLNGRATGSLPTVAVLGAEGLRLHSCRGDALVTRGDDGLFAVTPTAPRFEVRCRVALDGSDRLEGHTTAAVLEVVGAVADGEWVSAAAGAGRQFTVVRRLAGKTEEEDLPPSVTARYRLTLLPDETRFVHELEIGNPSRRHRRFDVRLASGERVESVEAKVAWDREGELHRFELPPGDTRVVLRGRLTGTRFTPPVAASLQYVLVESHPLVLPELRTSAKRVGVGETGIAPAYRGASAFLLDGGGALEWSVSRLEALKTAGISIERLSQVFFVGADGRARGEATFELDNQGASALALPTDAEPTFASLDGEPTFLTRDAEKRLFLPLGQGRQTLVVQDARAFGSRLGFASLALDLPRAGVPASAVDVEVRYPREWVPVFEAFAPSHGFGALSALPVVVAVFVALLLERLLSLLGVALRPRLLLAGALVPAAALLDGVAFVVGGGAAVLLSMLAIAALTRSLHGWRRIAAVAGLAVVALILGTLLTSTVSLDARFTPMPEVRQDVKFMKAPSLAEAPTASARGAPAPIAMAPPVPGAADVYRGVPARIQLPPGERRTFMNRELVDTAAPPPVRVVVVSAALVGWLEALAGLALLVAGFVVRRDLARAAAVFLERLRARPAAAEPPAPAPAS